MLSTSVNPVSFNPHRCSGRLLGVPLYTEEDIRSKGAYPSGPRPLNSICVCTHTHVCGSGGNGYRGEEQNLQPGRLAPEPGLLAPCSPVSTFADKLSTELPSPVKSPPAAALRSTNSPRT